MSFLAAFLARAEREPDRVAFVIERGGAATSLTHAALRDGARRWAGTLRAAGVAPGDVVLVALPLGPALLEAFLGALVAGAVPSMMPLPTPKQDPALFWSSHDALFTRLGGGLLVTTAENAAAVAAHVAGVAMRTLTPESAAAGRPFEGQPRPGGAIACLQHSSGTTGLKKGVALTFDAIDAQLDALARGLGLAAGDTIVSWLPLYHDMGFVACLLQPLASGVPAVLLDPFEWLLDPLAFLEAAARHRATLAWMPNFAFAHLVNAADEDRRADLSSLRALVDCSEVCRPETLAAFSATFAGWGLAPGAPRTCYAMAETVFAVTQSGAAPRVVTLDRRALEEGRAVQVEGGAAHVSVGTALPSVELSVRDEAGNALQEGRVGEIAVAAPFLFSGYHLEPERSAAVLRDNVYHTGDLGFRLGDDWFVLGRRDDLLVLLGRNVYAHEIEALLADVPGLKPGRAVALGVDDPTIGSRSLVVVAEADAGIDEAAARAAIRLRLESVVAVVPRRIVLVEPGWLVKSTSGKVARAENGRKLAARDAAKRGAAVCAAGQGRSGG